MIEQFFLAFRETVTNHSELYKILGVCGTVVLSFILYQFFNSFVEEENDFDSESSDEEEDEEEEDEEEEESETSGELEDDELRALEKENAELDAQWAEFWNRPEGKQETKKKQ